MIEAPDYLAWERQLWEAGYTAIAGVDEVGRGALAGPLVAAAVILPLQHEGVISAEPVWAAIRDSKVLSARRRAEFAAAIHESGALVSIASVSCDEIDAMGITAANRIAMERAVLALDVTADMLLIDALTVDLDTAQIGIIDGDAQSLSIAAASIVAKVYRDSLMIEMAAEWPSYGFERHKGYGTLRHAEALRLDGPCPHHRRSFAPVRNAIRQP